MTAKRAFTLVEILIVVILLGILAVIVVPKFSNATATARASMVADNLRIMRSQLVVFKSQHRDVAAGYPNCDSTGAPTEAAFIEHMTMASTSEGNLAAPGTPGFRHGPYFREIPPNPLNAKSTVQIIPDGAAVPAVGDDSHGWIYKPAELVFKADSPGADVEGVDFIDY